MALVDVITPVFNTPLPYLSVALDSLREQTVSDWKLWVIDDASEAAYSRQLEEMLSGYCDPRIHYVHSDHRGPAGSRNVGIGKGAAPYVALLDSDDRWKPSHLSRQLAVLEANKGVALVHGHYEEIDESGRLIGSRAPRRDLNDLTNPELFAKMLGENFVAASSVVVRREALERAGGFDDSFPCLVDKELWLRLLNMGAMFVYVPEVVLQYRIHALSVSRQTDLLLATRRRIIDMAEKAVQSNHALASVDWPRLKMAMLRHMNAEASAAYLRRGMIGLALKHSSPPYAGLSQDSCLLFCRCLYRLPGILGIRLARRIFARKRG